MGKVIYHIHHIIPRHMGGTDAPENLIKVSVDEHAELHRQLWEELGHWQDRIAWQCLSGQINLTEAKNAAIINGGQYSKGKKNIHKNGVVKKIELSEIDDYLDQGWQLGRNLNYKHTEDTKRKISEKNLNKTYSPETLEKMRKVKLGKKLSHETRKEMSESRRSEKNGFFGKTHTKETREILSMKCGHEIPWNKGIVGVKHTDASKQKISSALRGRSCSEETRQKMSESRRVYWENKRNGKS